MGVIVALIHRAPAAVVWLPLLVALASVGRYSALAVVLALITLASLVNHWLHWRVFTYEIRADDLMIAQGLLRRAHRSIPFERIQDVSIEQHFLPRLLGLALVRIEAGGSETDEGRLRFVTLAEARRVRDILRGRAERGAGGVHGDAAEAPPLFAITFPRLLLSGVFAFSPAWLLAVLGLVRVADEWIGAKAVWDRIFGELNAHHDPRTIVALVAMATLSCAVIGFANRVARDFGFVLRHADGRFHRIRGLLTRTEVVVRDRRIRTGLIRHAMVSGRFGWRSLEVETMGGSDDAGGRQQLAPLARDDEVARIIAAAGLPMFERDSLGPLSRAHPICVGIRHGTWLVLVVTAAGLLFPIAWFGMLLLPLPVGIAAFRRRYDRFALGKTSLQVARGVLSRSEWIVPFASMESVSIHCGPLQRLFGVATVHVDTAGARGWGRPHVEDIALAEAIALGRRLRERSDEARDAA